MDIERTIAGKPPDRRRAIRQSGAKPKLDEMAVWLDAQLKLIPGKSELTGAMRVMATLPNSSFAIITALMSSRSNRTAPSLSMQVSNGIFLAMRFHLASVD